MLSGFHHVTAISGDPRATIEFYTGFLGMRLVKRTVNFDDPGTHHFYFGGPAGEPGTLLTLFPWPTPRRARVGAGQPIEVAFETGSLRFWNERAAAYDVERTAEGVEFGERVLGLRDSFGMAIKLVERAAGPNALGRLHGVTICETDPAGLAAVLTDLLGFKRTGTEGQRQRFELAGGAARIDLWPASTPERGKAGPGAIHHVAWRVESEAEQDEWRARLMAAGLRVSIPQNRLYFRSIYFRAHRGVLFEIATVSPGFTFDEPWDALGGKLCLPPWLEPERASIEARLAPLDAAVIR